ncbi:MAG TPA: hypothetical protein VGC76_03760 [Pyrinomonadaceae bacterium]|jgi:hypothetical protein
MLENSISDTVRFWLAAFVAAFVSVGTAVLSVWAFQQYGWVLFVFSPVQMGILATLIYAPNNEQSFGRCFAVSMVSILMVAFVLLVIAFEGAICLVMAAPFALILNLFGVLIGKAISYAIQEIRVKNYVSLFLVLSIPFLLGFETSTKSKPILHKVVSTVEIEAPIEKVWETVVAFPQIEKQPEGILRLGFAYPVNAKIEGAGVGATRYCNFNTGAFVEPVTAWEKPNLLAFDVKSQPAPMIETSFYSNLHAAHMDFIKSERGQFRLYEKDGKTVVEGTTFYTHDIAPDFYWQLFSDEIIHQIHMRVLNHIKEVSEKN